MRKVLVANLNPAVDRTVRVAELEPGRTQRVLDGHLFAGGKGANVCRTLSRLGEEVCCLNILAGKAGELYASLLDSEGIPNLNALEPAGQTRFNVTIVSDAHHQETHLIDKGPLISQVTWAAFMASLQGLMEVCDWLIMAGSLPPGLPRDAYARMQRVARGKKTCLDSSGEALKLALDAFLCEPPAGPWLVKPNLQEAEEVLGRELRDEAAWALAIQEFWRSGVSCVAITLGGDGAVLGWKGQVWRGKVSLARTVSTVGCGDAFLAAMVWALRRDGSPPEEVLREALAASAASALTDRPGFFDEREREALRGQAQLARIA